MSEITIVGCGPGSRKFITPAALEAIEQSSLVIGSRRLVDEYGNGKIKCYYESIEGVTETLRNNVQKQVALLVTGSPGFFSLASIIKEKLKKRVIRAIPGLSSITYAFDTIGIPWHDAHFLSAHVSDIVDLNTLISQRSKVGILTSPKYTVSHLVKNISLLEALDYQFYVGERLSYNDECCAEYEYNDLLERTSDSLSVLIIVKKRNLVSGSSPE